MSVWNNLTRRRPRTRPRNAAAPATPGPRVPMVGRFPSVLASLTGTSDPEQQMETFGRSGTLHSVVTLAASSFSQVQWRLFRQADGRGRISGPDPVREVTSHAALDMWNKPNPWMAGQLFRESYQQHLKLTGLAYWVISYVGSIPAWMWPVRPDRMMPVPDAKTFIAGWVYTGPSGEQIPLENKEVVWLRQPHPLNPYGGMGAVEPLMPDIESASYTSQWNRNFFKNSAQPGGLYIFPDRVGDDQWEEMAERWAEQHQGVQRAHRVAFLEGGGQWVPATYSMKDMQFTELRQDGRDIIYEGYGTSKGMLGVVDDVNRANIEGSEYIYTKYRLGVDLARTKDVLNYQFLPLFGSSGQGVSFDADNPVPRDWQADAATTAANANAAIGLVQVGFDPEETLNAMSLPAIKHTGAIPSTVQPPLAAPAKTYEPAETEAA
ncbi:MAG TPA: phage portal protein [Pseudonocardiaceae bacterium]|nr:phage portal protein [Pseudonocardiaceae bacterium]